MIETPHITLTTTRLIAVIRLTIPRSEIQNVMGPSIREVMTTLAAQGMSPAGPWFTHYLRVDAEEFDFEICVPVSAPVIPAGRVEPAEWSTMIVARTVYHGPFEGLGDAWGELDAWITENGHTPATDLWECYLAGPESSPDPADWRTELSRPLIC